MARRTKSITQGMRKNRIEGLRELQQQIVDLKDAAAGREAIAVVADAGQSLKGEVLSSARGVNLPKDAQGDIFAAGPKDGQKGKPLAGLVGVRKRGSGKPKQDAKGYREWFPGKQTGAFDKTTRTKKRGGSLVIPGFKASKGVGQKIGENLATMWELGTTKMAPRPFFRTAIQAGKSKVISTISSGFQSILEKHAK